jgi:hypothetical protein
MLATKWERVKQWLPETKKSFEDLSETISHSARENWAKQEAEALKMGGKSLAIYGVALPQGMAINKVL